MKKKSFNIFFDKNDYQLLDIVNDVLNRGSQNLALRSLLFEHMHPQGIKEMAAPRGLRIAYVIANLLDTFDQGSASNRIKALRSLHDEVFLSSTAFDQVNTARVLLQIMKELIRSRDNELQQLKLAHDFRMVSAGNPRRVRAELTKYHLLEMPEGWNQYAFDNHVHDANTKGRKSPTHMVMDAWIKGIRYLTVVYYNYVSPEVIEELIEASSILDVHVQVGIEMSAKFRDKYVRFTWEPHGFNDNRSFLKFIKDEAVVQLMEEGRKVSHYQQRYVFDVLDAFNDEHRKKINSDLKLSLEPLLSSDFISFVGVGQPSLLHLGRFIYNALTPCIQQSISTIDGENGTVPQEKEQQQQRLSQLMAISVDTIIDQFLLPSRNLSIHDPSHPEDNIDVPELLELKSKELLDKLLSLYSSSKFTLNLSNLSIQDTLEVLYSCAGMITHVEMYNLKDAGYGISSSVNMAQGSAGESVSLKSPNLHYSLISGLQKALNDDNVISLKRVIRAIVWDYDEQCHSLKKQIELLSGQVQAREKREREFQEMLERKEQLLEILYHLEDFHNYYKKRPLRSRVGSGSTGQSAYHHGMGMVVLETLPVRARKVAQEEVSTGKRTFLPVTALLTKNSHRRSHDFSFKSITGKFLAKIPFLKNSRSQQWYDWSLDALLVHPPMTGNVVTLGGFGRNGEVLKNVTEKKAEERLDRPWKYLNTNLKNWLKVLLGFIPAFLTFSLTKDWWVLAYLGAFIWFGITGSRNIIQSVLGGGGLIRSPLLPWNSLVSWSRIADSLLYTGFSVPLLDYLVKTLLLSHTFGVTTSTNPIVLYSVMGLANGIYISGHNLFRGLPRSAAVGNFFRSILAIPLAILLNSVISTALLMAGVPDVSGELQKWAAVISKLASDCVAAVIEGLVDRQTNIQKRLVAYRIKISQLFGVFARLDLQFPEEDVLEMLESPKMMMETLNYEARDQEKLIIVNGLDLMYFWMYQPRARKALAIMLQEMSREEWLIFYRSQLVLHRNREISQVFVDGLVGKNFSKALSFYLDHSEEYLSGLEKFGAKKKWD